MPRKPSVEQPPRHFADGVPWGQGFAAFVESENAAKALDPSLLSYSRAIAAFCIEHRVARFDLTIDWFGFGPLKVAFDHDQLTGESERPQMMFWVSDFVEPSGIDLRTLFDFWNSAREDDWDDVFLISYETPHGTGQAYLLGITAAMRAMTLLSPWREEYYRQTRDLMGNAMRASGLGETLLDGGTGWTALGRMVNADTGETETVALVIDHFRLADQMPMIKSPYAVLDGDDNPETIPIVDVVGSYEILRTAEALDRFLGPQVDKDEALRRCFAGPTSTLTTD